MILSWLFAFSLLIFSVNSEYYDALRRKFAKYTPPDLCPKVVCSQEKSEFCSLVANNSVVLCPNCCPAGMESKYWTNRRKFRMRSQCRTPGHMHAKTGLCREVGWISWKYMWKESGLLLWAEKVWVQPYLWGCFSIRGMQTERRLYFPAFLQLRSLRANSSAGINGRSELINRVLIAFQVKIVEEKQSVFSWTRAVCSDNARTF